MNLLAFLRPKPSTAGQVLAAEGKWKRRMAIREQVDRMRAEMGKPPVDWNAL